VSSENQKDLAAAKQKIAQLQGIALEQMTVLEKMNDYHKENTMIKEELQRKKQESIQVQSQLAELQQVKVENELFKEEVHQLKSNHEMEIAMLQKAADYASDPLKNLEIQYQMAVDQVESMKADLDTALEVSEMAKTEKVESQQECQRLRKEVLNLKQLWVAAKTEPRWDV
jgi:hypothetical protein